mgnify:CR=1 FL=1
MEVLYNLQELYRRFCPRGPSGDPLNKEELDRLVDETIEGYGSYISSAMARLYRFMGLTTLEWAGRGAVVIDIYGREYIDCHGCNGTIFHGRGHPKILEAVHAQLEQLTISSRILPHKPMVDLARLLAEVAPGDLQYTFFANSGTEAVEGALKLARAYTRRPHFVAAVKAFHGKSFGSLSASGRELYREPFYPLLPDFTHVPFGDAAAIEQAIREDTAAVILEPIQGEAGVVVPPDDYLPRVREICDRKGILLILDEVQTGLGRTGKLFASEHYGVVPDIMTLAKILGGGVMPIGAFMARPHIFEFFDANPYIHSSTFGGNPLACAAGLAALRVTLEEGLVEEAARKGDYLLAGLRRIQARYPRVVGEVRGKGLMAGLEMTKDGVGGVVIAALVEQGVLAIHSLNNERVIRMLPPAVIEMAQLDRALAAMETAVAGAERVFDQL